VVDAAEAPGFPYKPDYPRNAGLGLLAGMFLGVAFVIATWFGGEAWASAMAGWAGIAAAFQGAQSALWRRSLTTPGEFGEYARDQAVHAADIRWGGRLA